MDRWIDREIMDRIDQEKENTRKKNVEKKDESEGGMQRRDAGEVIAKVFMGHTGS